MSKPTKHLLVSLPTSINPSNDHDEALTALRATVSAENGTVIPFQIPSFKIGTLDALVQQADELAKLEKACEAVVGKVGESLRSILDGDEDKLVDQKRVQGKPTDKYLSTFTWSKNQYRTDKSIAELVSMLQKEVTNIDTDVKTLYSKYNQAKTSLTNLQRKQIGNLSNRSLASIVPPSVIIQDSEYLETHLVAVPAQLTRDFLKMYETISPWVVPQSAQKITFDDEFTLFAATSFKKYSPEFIHKCREQRWIPRDFKFKEGGKEEEKKELESAEREERKLWGQALALGKTGWSDAVQAWVHVLALQVFVETVLRYGLPLSFVCGLVKTTPKLAKKIRTALDGSYSYLGGNALGRDKKGRITKDDSSTSAEMQAAGGDTSEYSAYVCYEFEIH